MKTESVMRRTRRREAGLTNPWACVLPVTLVPCAKLSAVDGGSAICETAGCRVTLRSTAL